MDWSPELDVTLHLLPVSSLPEGISGGLSSLMEVQMAIRTNASCAFVCKTDDSHNAIHKRPTFTSTLPKECVYQENKIEKIWCILMMFLYINIFHLLILLTYRQKAIIIPKFKNNNIKKWDYSAKNSGSQHFFRYIFLLPKRKINQLNSSLKYESLKLFKSFTIFLVKLLHVFWQM